MNVTLVGALQFGEFPNILFVEAYVYETVASYLLGKNPLRIERHPRELHDYHCYGSSG